LKLDEADKIVEGTLFLQSAKKSEGATQNSSFAKNLLQGTA
jgi:hypothetical protein